MRSNSISLLLGFAVVALIPSAAVGEIIYSQATPENPTAAFSSVNTIGGQVIADNFVLEGQSPITIRSLRIIGGYTVRNPPPITPSLDALPVDNFRVIFLDDDEGLPGSPIFGADFAIGSAFRRIPTGGNLLNGSRTPFDFAIDLGEGITLSPERVFWISITNDPGPEHSWMWARSFGEFDRTIVTTREDPLMASWVPAESGGMFFELDDRNIPEPTSICIVTIAIGCVFAYRSPKSPKPYHCSDGSQN